MAGDCVCLFPKKDNIAAAGPNKKKKKRVREEKKRHPAAVEVETLLLSFTDGSTLARDVFPVTRSFAARQWQSN